MRKLVTHRIIDDILTHPNADALEIAVIGGWNVITRKGEFQKGDSCVFFEIDSFLPADDDRFEFLLKGGTKKDPSGRERIRLKTVKLRKEISQGLALPWSMFPELHDYEGSLDDVDLSEDLDIIKYERPEPKVANASGNFPEFCPRTDEQRIQNLWNKWSVVHKDKAFVPTLKLDGSSCTVAYLDEELNEYWKGDGIDVFDEETNEKVAEIICCSRNLQLKYDPDSHFWKSAENSGIIQMLRDIQQNLAVQGECIGPGIQQNKEGLHGFRFFVFSIFNIDEQSYYEWDKIELVCHHCNVADLVPVVSDIRFPFKTFETVDEMLEHADGPSLNAKTREGIVWKCLDDPNLSVKAISNKFLLAGKDD